MSQKNISKTTSAGAKPGNFPATLPAYYRKYIDEGIVLTIVVKYDTIGHRIFGEIPDGSSILDWSEDVPTKLVPLHWMERQLKVVEDARSFKKRVSVYNERILSRRAVNSKELFDQVSTLQSSADEEAFLARLTPELRNILILNNDDFRRYTGLDFGILKPGCLVDQFSEEERQRLCALRIDDDIKGVPVRKALSKSSDLFEDDGSVKADVTERSLMPRLLAPGFLVKRKAATAASVIVSEGSNPQSSKKEQSSAETGNQEQSSITGFGLFTTETTPATTQQSRSNKPEPKGQRKFKSGYAPRKN